MNTNSLLFYFKKSKNYVNGPKPIYMRITVGGVPRELSAGRECDPVRWNPVSNRVKGQKEEIRNLNEYLDTLERKIEDAHSSLVKQGVDITSEGTSRTEQPEDEQLSERDC